MSILKKRRLKNIVIQIGLATGITIAGSSAFASGFQIWEQSAEGVGNFHAGGAARANDASTAYYNPAGMTHLKHPEISFGAVGINTDLRYKGSGTFKAKTGASPDKPQQIGFTEFGTAQGGTFNVVPNFSLVVPIGTRWALGFSVTTPFGLSTHYDDFSVVSSLATESQIRTINLGPSVAFQINKMFSVGAGVDVQYGEGEFDQFIRIPFFDPDANALPVPNNDLIGITNDFSDWAVGFNAGALAQLDEHTRIGLTFRSKMVHKVSGDSHASAVSKDTSGGKPISATTSSHVSASIPLPPTTTLSFYHEFSHVFTGLATISFTQWDVIKTITLNNVSILTPTFDMTTGKTTGFTPGTQNVDLPLNFRNTWNFAVGGNVHLNKHWTWQFGLGFDQTPVTDKYRSLRLPDADHYAVSTGVQWKALEHLLVTLGYMHIFIPQARINSLVPLVQGGKTPSWAQAQGHVDGDADVVGLQVNWKLA